MLPWLYASTFAGLETGDPGRGTKIVNRQLSIVNCLPAGVHAIIIRGIFAMIKLLVIADDLTGSLDTGVQFARQGLKTQVDRKSVV